MLGGSVMTPLKKFAQLNWSQQFLCLGGISVTVWSKTKRLYFLEGFPSYYVLTFQNIITWGINISDWH